MSFISDRVGFVLRVDGYQIWRLLKTADGGETWTDVAAWSAVQQEGG